MRFVPPLEGKITRHSSTYAQLNYAYISIIIAALKFIDKRPEAFPLELADPYLAYSTYFVGGGQSTAEILSYHRLHELLFTRLPLSITSQTLVACEIDSIELLDSAVYKCTVNFIMARYIYRFAIIIQVIDTSSLLRHQIYSYNITIQPLSMAIKMVKRSERHFSSRHGFNMSYPLDLSE